MDNNEQTAPQGEAGATASSGQSEEVVTQPVETTEPVSDGEVAETGTATYPWESDERFKGKSPEDIWNTYQDAQKAIGQASQKAEVVNLLEKHTGMNANEIKNFLAQQEKQQMEQQIKANPGLAAFQEVQSLKSQIALQAEEKELDGFLQKNPEYAPFRDKIFNIGLNLEKDKSYEDIAKDYFGDAIAQGQQVAYKKIENKQQTQATGAISTPQKKLTAEDMKKMSSAELAAILPHVDTSGRPY
jgi:hypothetical protein